MQPRYPGGLPVNYLPSCNAATNRRQSCATQATGNLTDPPSVDSFYIPSPASQVTEVAHPAQSQPSSAALFPMTINTSIPAYQNSQICSASSSPQGIWPTPPSTTCEEEFENYSYQGSPMSASRSTQPILPCSGHSSSASPRSWSPQEAHHISIHQTFFNEPDSTMPQPEVLSNAHGHLESSPAAVVQTESPQAEQELEASYNSYSQDGTSHEPDEGLREDEQGSEKVDGPYAQLIHRAFMSRRTRAMTLQEIYQWFRENTNKEKTDKGNKGNGWQNSIRHNLSMNHAFVRREQRPTSDDPLNRSAEEKKISQWVLEEWAVNGVQSTTRYRSKGSSNRRAKSRSVSQTNTHASVRAVSGRKGGKKAAASKRAILSRQNTGSAYTHGNSAHNIQGQMQNVTYEGMQYPLPTHLPVQPRSEPATPPGPSHESMMLASNPMPSMVLQANNTSQEFSFGSNVPQYSHTGHHNMYALENVTGLFQGHQATIAIQRSHGLSSTMHPDFNSLFEAPEDSRNNGHSMPYWNQPGASSQFQP
ncbi:hypothetical protein K445DRAFT_310746 [Daldinia sp. EC12]|nr:hypothetical protein K445DRAFT_310746 [Daldinia sp. EC12]